ncbi:helix-hairpin-helix domain-containing protein [Paenibacillus sp. MDMC362]|uniref:ComEA family DNA-binding protein n=1 Tax=Paenibacillus sp. MDMC362 TaxID=2977365 RepID=UPI000DC3A493|nr:helix-hairpin-helix domain-containing protein [Paenibacillus sp. MDMC362]RAR43969.1 helix-hairpin-helix domain-containing protein [Paenibacillus sp. MDMC362]
MKRISLGWSLAATIAGCGFILFAGGADQGIEGWQPLNDQLEQVVAAEENKGVKTSEADSLQKNVELSEAGTDSKPADKSTQTMHIEPASNSHAKDTMPDQDQGAAGSGLADHTAPSSVSGQPSSPPVPPPQAEGVSQQLQQQAPVRSTAQSPPAPDPSGLINVNTADAATLMELPGIGEAKAKAIIDYRNQFGPFKSQADLMNVKGIGPKMLEKMKPYVGL